MAYTVLEGVVGSRAYGMAGPDSDTDMMAVVVPTAREFLGLRSQACQRSTQHHDPDRTEHELGVFVSLCLKCNPSAMEILWLDEYTKITDAGRSLLEIREDFLSSGAVRAAYGGYVKAQLSRANGLRTTKALAHAYRLAWQGVTLLQSGQLMVRLPETQRAFALGIRNGKVSERHARRVTAGLSEVLCTKVKGSGKMIQRTDRIEDFLVSSRLHYLTKEV